MSPPPVTSSQNTVLARAHEDTRMMCPPEACGGGTGRSIAGAAAGLSLAALIGNWFFGDGHDPPDEEYLPPPPPGSLWHCVAIISVAGYDFVGNMHTHINQKIAVKHALKDCRKHGTSPVKDGGCHIICSKY